VVVTDASSQTGAQISEQIPFLRKSGMQLGSKMRYLSAQLNALYESGLALELAKHANSMAQFLYENLIDLADDKKLIVDLAPQANAVFPIMDSAAAQLLREKWAFYDWDTNGRVRLMCSWNTEEAEIKEFLLDLREAIKH
jgi:threonine aldolase